MRNRGFICNAHLVNHSYLFITVTILSFSSIAYNQDIDDISQRVKKLIAGNLDENGVFSFNKWLGSNLQDPQYIDSINISDSGLTSYQGSFREMQLSGLKSFTLETIELNIGELDFNITARIANVSLTGQYSIDGKISYVPVSGNGFFWMNLTDVLITCVTDFNTIDRVINASEVKLDAIPGGIDLYFDRLFGSGPLSTLSNAILNALSYKLFDEIKTSTLPITEEKMRKEINSQLKSISRLSPTSDTLVDEWITKLQTMIRETNNDPLSLDSKAEDLSANFLSIKVNGKLYNGKISGLSTIKRTGHIRAIYSNDSLTLEMNMGLENLTATFDWFLSVGLLGQKDGSLIFTVDNLYTFTRLVQPLRKGAQMEVNHFSIVNITHLWLDVNGLGAGDYVLEIFTNLALNRFKAKIRQNIAQPLENLIKSTLAQQSITFI